MTSNSPSGTPITRVSADTLPADTWPLDRDEARLGGGALDRTNRMRIIRRYPNRKFYDTGQSCHIRLERVAELIRLGEDVRVFNTKTGRDITTAVYAQILAAEERRVPRLSVAGLVAIIRRGLE